jgi:hypothetical protein
MQGRPDLSRFREIPAFSQWRQRDQYEQVAHDLQEHDWGKFYRSACLVDEMMTDDRIAGVLNTRIGGFLSVPVTFRPGDDRRRSEKLADILGGDAETEDDGMWPLIVTQDCARELLKWRIMLGVAVGEVRWITDANKWRPVLVPVHPRYLWWNWAEDHFVLQMWEPSLVINLPKTQDEPTSDGKWFLWGGLRSWMNGAVRAMGLKYLGRAWNERDWFRYNEKHGLPLTKGMVPSASDEKEKLAFRNDLNNVNHEPTVICPVQSDGVKFDVEWVETKGSTTGGETFRSLKSAIDTDIAILLLGQNLTTESGSTGTTGARATAQVHDLIRIDKKKEDSDFYKVVRAQVLTWWAKYNFGDPELAPYPTAHVEPEEDDNREADTLSKLGDAVKKLKDAEPRTDRASIMETFGVPLLDPDDPDAQPPVLPPGPGQEPGFHAFGPGGEHVSGPHATKDEAKEAGQKAAGGGPVVIREQQEKPPPQKQEKLAALRSVPLSAKTKPHRIVRYQDALARNSARKAADALGPMLEHINGVIATASDAKDLKRKLVALYRQASPQQLAKVFQRAGVLANLAGRQDLLKEI